MDKLKLLELAENFKIEQQTDGTYLIQHKECDVVAFIYGEEIEYAVGDARNLQCDYITIDMDGLKQLIEFCELMAS